MKRLLMLLLPCLAGCAGSDSAPGPDHPANPDAPEAAWTPPPDRFAGPVEPLAEPAAPEGAVWTCPMHPEVKSDKPGSCPKCGMDLAPVKTGHEEHDHK
jgi:hypothetical protein